MNRHDQLVHAIAIAPGSGDPRYSLLLSSDAARVLGFDEADFPDENAPPTHGRHRPRWGCLPVWLLRDLGGVGTYRFAVCIVRGIRE